jgi:CRP/FNR family cyclic AMP-dependent transcriptional regulator
MGSCGRRRGLIVREEGLSIKIPTDLLGLTPLSYSRDRHESLKARIAPICAELTNLVARLGPR